jgi:hypothetical protein
MSDNIGREIRRLWGKTEVVDALEPLRVIVEPCDVASAARTDPAHCVFANACRRLFRSSKVLFWRTVAYVELPDENGKKRVERFVMGETMRQVIASFDRGEGVLPEAGFILRPPTSRETLERKREKGARSEARMKARGEKRARGRHGRVQGKTSGSGEVFRDDPIAVETEVRSGSGRVRFAKTITDAARLELEGASPGLDPRAQSRK